MEERQRAGRFLFSSFFLIEVIPFPQSSMTKGQLVVIVIAALTCVLSVSDTLLSPSPNLYYIIYVTVLEER